LVFVRIWVLDNDPKSLEFIDINNPSLTCFLARPYFEENNMSKNIIIKFPETQQERSKRTLDDILQAAFDLVDQANPNKFTSRALSARSGYTLSTLCARLGVIENAFLWVIKQGQTRHIETMIQRFRDFDTNLPLQSFIEIMVDNTFKVLEQVNPKVIRYYEECIAKQNAMSSEFYHYVDAMAEPYAETALRNQTNTFRLVSLDEAIFLIRSSQTILERPFVELNPIAGTEVHRKIAVTTLVQMFGK